MADARDMGVFFDEVATLFNSLGKVCFYTAISIGGFWACSYIPYVSRITGFAVAGMIFGGGALVAVAIAIQQKKKK